MLFFNATTATEIYTLSLHDALPICFFLQTPDDGDGDPATSQALFVFTSAAPAVHVADAVTRSEEHTSELQSLAYLVCRLLLEKKNLRQALQFGKDAREAILFTSHDY